MTNSQGVARHLSDEVLIRLLSNELPEGEAHEPKQHLAVCWRCRARYDDLEEIALGIATYSREQAAPDSEPPTDDDPFLERLRLAARAAVFQPWWSQPWWSRVFASLWNRPIPLMSSAAASFVLVVVTAGVVLVWQRNLPTVTASELISRAVAADAEPSKLAGSGVAYEKIRVRAKTGTFEHTVYRDVAGHRRPRPTDTDKLQHFDQAKLAVAGIAWDQPISASAFKTWHDEQTSAVDEVRTSGEGLLTLATKVSQGIVIQESLTVRADTFRPVERSVEFADSGVIDFLELSFDVLPWSAVKSDLFEPLAGPLVPEHSTAHAASALAPIAPLTAAQLDEAELQARLVLDTLNAESSERLQITRSLAGVRITGIVPTDERKTELQAGLKTLPHVSTSIATFEEVEKRPRAGSEITSVQSASVVEKPTPLAAYLVAHGRTPEESAGLSRQLLSAAVAAYQETKALADLRSRFADGAPMTDNGAAAFGELLARHRKALLAALGEEEKVLVETRPGLPGGLPVAGTSNDPAESMSAAEKNLRLCKELSSGTGEVTGTVEQAVLEVADRAARLRAFAQTPATVRAGQSQSPIRRY